MCACPGPGIYIYMYGYCKYHICKSVMHIQIDVHVFVIYIKTCPEVVGINHNFNLWILFDFKIRFRMVSTSILENLEELDHLQAENWIIT